MVNKDADGRTDRGQLVLIGAISIAFILLGVVVVFNGVQYTETINSGGPGDDLAAVQMTESELRAGVEILVKNNGGTISEGEIENYIDDIYQNKAARERPVYITYDDGSWDGSEFEITIRTEDITVTRTIEVQP